MSDSVPSAYLAQRKRGGWLPPWRLTPDQGQPSADPAELIAVECALGLLTVVPMSVTVAGKVYEEGDPELTVELLLALAAGRTASTSRPSPGRFEKIFRGLLDSDYQSILSLYLSGELSRTVALALGLGCAQPLASAVRGQSLE